MTATKMTMAQSINAALRDAMTADESVLVFGEDVGPLGGVFRVTDGLTETFGEQRCFDTPLAESGIVGMAIGMAMNGMRPVVEMQFDAFAYPAFEQIVSHAAKMANRTRGKLRVPLVIRIPYAGGIGGVEHHCDSSEAYWVSTPGLKVVAPGTASDAYWLLRQAIASDDPVIFLEPKRRYWAKEEIAAEPAAPFHQAVVRRSGTDVTLIGYGSMVPTLLETADAAAEDGISAEVIDLRSLAPFDDRTVVASVRRTGRAVVVHEASGFAGFGAEIVARLTEQCFHQLHAPIGRVTGFDIPYPPPMLEQHHLPSVDRILDAVDRLQFDDTVVLPGGPGSDA
jgi:pyruvate dehydrogenase E1 component beta subunit